MVRTARCPTSAKGKPVVRASESQCNQRSSRNTIAHLTADFIVIPQAVRQCDQSLANRRICRQPEISK